MTDNDRNTRTLIMAFTVAVVALVPLRFMEVDQLMSVSQPQVLGETVVSEVKPEVVASKPGLEAPYDELDGRLLRALNNEICVEVAEAVSLVNKLNSDATLSSESKAADLLSQARQIEAKMCQ